MEIHPIAPVWDEHSRVLILGSFPSVRSRQEGFFYGHPQNRFWKILAALWEEPVPASVPEKTDFLLRRRIALWDVIACCEVEGSADSSLRNVVINDITPILRRAPIRCVFTNGSAASALYKKHLASVSELPQFTLPSSSPANAAWSLPRLCEAWRVIRTEAERDGAGSRRSGELFRQAEARETDAVTSLYRDCVGLPGCTWDEEYPSRKTAEQDLAAGALYVLYDGETLVGAVSRIEHDDLDELPVWSESEKPAILVRMAVSPSLQHRGWGTKLLAYALEDAWKSGADSVRLLCARENGAALALYRRAGFSVRGETEMYGHRYFCMERLRRREE